MEPQSAISATQLVLLNLIIATLMYGVALDLRLADFRRLLAAPAAPLAAMLAQFGLLPALTCLATWVFSVPAELALAMILVASCPGGNFSNVLTGLAKGNVALSISMTAASSLLAVVMTPFNFALYGWLNPNTRALTKTIGVEPAYLLGILLLVLGLPVLLAMLTRHLNAALAMRLHGPMSKGSVVVLILFVGVAFYSGRDVIALHGGQIALLATLHNTSALLLGAAIAALAKLSAADRRAVTIEVGVHNTGLGLLILFNFYPQATPMILFTAFWGLPHLVSGLGLAWWWARTPIQS